MQGKLYVIECIAAHFQVFVDRKECAQECDDDAKEEYGCRYDDDCFHVDDGNNLWLKLVEPINSTEDEQIGYGSRDDAEGESVCQERSAYEIPAGSDEFHRVDDESLGEDGQTHRVVDERE